VTGKPTSMVSEDGQLAASQHVITWQDLFTARATAQKKVFRCRDIVQDCEPCDLNYVSETNVRKDSMDFFGVNLQRILQETVSHKL
jgi:hypothetical protein